MHEPGDVVAEGGGRPLVGYLERPAPPWVPEPPPHGTTGTRCSRA